MTSWRALVVNGTFYEVLDQHRERMEREGLELVEEDAYGLTDARVYELAGDLDVIFGPGRGLRAPLFKHATRLRTISVASSGYESVDVAAATAAGVVVTNAPTPLMSAAVAEVAFGLVLSVSRQIPQNHCKLAQDGRADRPLGVLVQGKTLGIVGLGYIGKVVAQRGRGFDMRVLAYEQDRFWHGAFAARHGVERVSIETLLRESDFVSLHLRATPSTIGFIGARELGLMKPSAYLINTARASLVDRDALYAALSSGRIAGLGSDVIADGGLDSEMLSLPNVVGLHHLGNRCTEAVYDVMETAIDNALAVLRGGRPNYLLNPEVVDSQDRRRR